MKSRGLVWTVLMDNSLAQMAAAIMASVIVRPGDVPATRRGPAWHAKSQYYHARTTAADTVVAVLSQGDAVVKSQAGEASIAATRCFRAQTAAVDMVFAITCVGHACARKGGPDQSVASRRATVRQREVVFMARAHLGHPHVAAVIYLGVANAVTYLCCHVPRSTLPCVLRMANVMAATVVVLATQHGRASTVQFRINRVVVILNLAFAKATANATTQLECAPVTKGTRGRVATSKRWVEMADVSKESTRVIIGIVCYVCKPPGSHRFLRLRWI